MEPANPRSTDECSSDDEIFFGPMTLKEVKIRLGITQRSTISSEPPPTDESDRSVQIIETKSEPDLLKDTHHESTKVVLTPKQITTPNPNRSSFEGDGSVHQSEAMDSETPTPFTKIRPKAAKLSLDEDDSFLQLEAMVEKLSIPITDQIKANVDMPSKNASVSTDKLTYLTPNKGESKADEFSTPYMSQKSKTPIFKTPCTAPGKRPTNSGKNTLLKTNAAYNHIASPIASYIKNGVQTPLFSKAQAKKTTTIRSGIPKLVKTTTQSTSNNKENNLPHVAYHSAKKTLLVEVPSGKKLPASQWATKNYSSLPKAQLIKHEHKEKITQKKPQIGDSFEITLNEAELSVCTQTSALNTPKYL